jgi:hypothetical protein
LLKDKARLNADPMFPDVCPLSGLYSYRGNTQNKYAYTSAVQNEKLNCSDTNHTFTVNSARGVWRHVAVLRPVNELRSDYTGCPRRNVPDFGRVFLMLRYTDITQNTYIQSWMVMEIMAREKNGLLAVPRTVPVKLTRFPYTAHVI